MNIAEHTINFIKEAKRRNYRQNTIDNYVSCIKIFFAQSIKDHPKNLFIQWSNRITVYCKLTKVAYGLIIAKLQPIIAAVPNTTIA